MIENQTLGIIFSNMHDDLLGELTARRTTGSVPFGGRYRFIDFTLSNMVNAGITDVGVVAKSNYQSLLDHLGSGKEWDLSRRGGGLHILPPFSSNHTNIYRGRIEALAGIIGYIKHSKAKYVIMTDCNVIANIDYADIIDSHAKSGCDITIAYKKMDISETEGETNLLFTVGEDGVVTDVMKNIGNTKNANVSLNICVMKKETMEKMIEYCSAHNIYSFRRDILLSRDREYSINAYEFKGYTALIQTAKDYFESNMDLLKKEVREDLFCPQRPIYTKVHDEVSAHYGLGSSVKNSLLADGCVIKGQVENSIIFRGVTVEEGAVVKNSVLMQSTVVPKDVELDYVVTDKNVTITEGRSLKGFETYPIYIPKNTKV
jgi:glucose-1-phosphate adenylyltransferase